VPGVAASAVIGLPHPDFGEAVIAVVTTAPGTALDEQALRSALRNRLAGFKVPHPLRDEMVLRVGVDDRREATARAAVAAAAAGCAAIFRQLKLAWQTAIAAETGRPVTPPRGSIIAPPPAAPKRTVGARKAPTFVKKTGTVAAPATGEATVNPFNEF
jgi:DNA-directed RNA polymerase subunit L